MNYNQKEYASSIVNRTEVAVNFTWAPWIIFLAAVLLQILAFDPLIGIYDEGLIVTGAELISSGKLPYRDFWTMYGPAQFYLTSWGFDVFGHADLVVRAIGIVSKALIVSASYSLVALLSPRVHAAIAAAVILFLLIAARQDAFPVFPAVAFSLLSILWVVKGFNRNGKYLFFAGLSTAVVIAFRHDLGAYNALAVVVSLFVANLSVTNSSIYLTVKKTFIQSSCYGAGIILILVPILSALLYFVPLDDLNENLIQIPSKIYPHVRSLPFPALHDFLISKQLSIYVVYAPFVALLWAFAAEIHSRASRSSVVGAIWVPLVIITCALFIIKGLVRTQFLHMVQSLVFVVVLIAFYVGKIRLSSGVAKLVLVPGLLVLLLLMGSQIRQGGKEILQGVKDIVKGRSVVLGNCFSPPLPSLRCIGVDENYLNAAKYVIEHTEPNDKIYVGVAQHRKLFLNAVSFYFMVGRQPVTKWYDLHPGVQTQERIQRLMISEMEGAPPKLIVLDDQWDQIMEPNDSRFATGSGLLDSYIRDKYKPIQRFGTIELWELR